MNSVNSRHAALTLHALPVADREWVLRRLDPQQQLLVESHLEELRGLGIPAEAELVHHAIRQSAPIASESAWRATVAAHSGGEMADVLHGEPAALVARLLDLGPWNWEAEFLQNLSTAARGRVATFRERADVASHDLDAWLLREWVARLAPAKRPDMVKPEPAPRGGPIAWWRRIVWNR